MENKIKIFQAITNVIVLILAIWLFIDTIKAWNNYCPIKINGVCYKGGKE